MLVAAAAGCCVLATPDAARAGNAEHPRTPVEWENVGCMEIVDRSVAADYTFAYAVPFEDTDLTPDEVADSRTHQFFAVCRQLAPHESLPSWISTDDVAAAMANYDELDAPPAEDILEAAAAWNGCWYRITGDDARRSITEAAAADPVTWDTAAVQAGVYVLWGYTYEPVFNLWAPRAGGVVRILDGEDSAELGPAAAVTSGEQAICVGDSVVVEGCVDATAGTTMTASFAVGGPGDVDPVWTPFAENIDVEGDTFSLSWAAPEAASGETMMVRVEFTDPNGATYVAYQHELDIVLPSSSAGCGGDTDGCEGGFVPDPACDGGSSTTELEPGTTGDETPTQTSGGDGCGCRHQRQDLSGVGILALLCLLATRRQRDRTV